MKFPLISTKAFFQKALMLIIALQIGVSSFAQKKEKNLVPNPSFEKHKNKANTIKNAIPWQGDGTVDYYMKPEKLDTSRYKGAHTGTCFAGLRFQPKYKEYMSVQLTEALVKGAIYNFKMYVRLVGCSTVTLKQLGVYFSDKPFESKMSFDEEGILDSTYANGIAATQGWIPIQGEYTAAGRERFIILGNFKTKMKEDFVRIKKWDVFEMREAYYYIDDISVCKKLTAADSTFSEKKIDNKAEYIFPDSFKAGQVIEIKNIEFETGSAKLLKPSFKVLDELISVLNDHPFMEIQINGHSDNNGKESENRKLAKARAKAVYDYLLSQSVINPMTYKGFGFIQPMVVNDSEENNAKNRRVEFVIIKE